MTQIKIRLYRKCILYRPPSMYYQFKRKIHVYFKYFEYSKRQISDSSKFKESGDYDVEFDKNGAKFSKWIENTVGKGEIARYEQFLLFPQRFQTTCTADT